MTTPVKDEPITQPVPIPSPAPTTKELLDWEAGVEVPPHRPQRRIYVQLRDLGRDKPQPIEFPEGDAA